MTMKMKETTYAAPTPQILAIPDHYVSFGQIHEKTGGAIDLSVLVGGRQVVKAGTIYPANDLTATGVVLNDYDVTDGDAMMAIVKHGFIKTSMLPEAPSADTASSQLGADPFTYTAPVDGGRTTLEKMGIVFIDPVA